MISRLRVSIRVFKDPEVDLKKKKEGDFEENRVTRNARISFTHDGSPRTIHAEKKLMKTNERILVERSKEACKSLGLIKFARICSMI